MTQYVVKPKIRFQKDKNEPNNIIFFEVLSIDYRKKILKIRLSTFLDANFN